jgi:hypothetical protein
MPDEVAEQLLSAPIVTSDGADSESITIKHLEFIQSVITRMASNSFLLKGWSVTIVAALLGVAAQQDSALFAAAALLPAAAFWGMDAYYLHYERLYRRLYDDARRPPAERRHAVEPFSLSIEAYRREVPPWSRTLFRHFLVGLHGTITLVVVVATIYFAAS